MDKVLRDSILGHTILGMDAYYMKPSDDVLKAAMRKYTDWLEQEIKEASAEADVEASVEQQ